ncbi:hypothetical protein [Candidatus Thiosymbion oneisti]|uniref:hypothetical protein n=1 Tax=Candidatus Thiosymbion oneisti TaxID=589554 RepID=UPI000B7EDE04|nr:hypothetical protein [Candidatus Thiosymbion oneisti]
MVTENSDNIPHYDAALALSAAGDVPAVRDEIANGILDLFSDKGELAALFEVSLYRRDPTRSRVLTHRAIGLAKQGAMPSLELLCKRINTAINSGEFAVAEELGRELPVIIESIRTIVSENQS